MAIIYGGRSGSSLPSQGVYSTSPFGAGNNVPVSSIVSVQPHTVFDDIRQAIINGIDSAQAEGTGWDAVVKAGLPVTAVVRTSDTVVTITLPAFASYDITADETVTATVPAVAVASVLPIVATPTFSITAFVAAGITAIVRTVLQAVNRAYYY